MGGLSGYCAEQKSNRGRQISYDLTYTWNLNKKINEQANRNWFINTENMLPFKVSFHRCPEKNF